MVLDQITLDLAYLAVVLLGATIQLAAAGLVSFAVFDLLISVSKVVRRG